MGNGYQKPPNPKFNRFFPPDYKPIKPVQQLSLYEINQAKIATSLGPFKVDELEFRAEDIIPITAEELRQRKTLQSNITSYGQRKGSVCVGEGTANHNSLPVVKPRELKLFSRSSRGSREALEVDSNKPCDDTKKKANYNSELKRKMSDCTAHNSNLKRLKTNKFKISKHDRSKQTHTARPHSCSGKHPPR